VVGIEQLSLYNEGEAIEEEEAEEEED